MSELNDENHINGRRRPKRPARQKPESSSDSDSDVSLARPARRSKTRRVVSDSSSSSSIILNKVPRRVVRRVMSNSSDESDSDNSSVTLHTRRRKIRRVLNDSESGNESSSSAEEGGSYRSGLGDSSNSEESGASSGEFSEDSDWQTDVSEQDEELQQALAASLAESNQAPSPKLQQQRVQDSQVTSPKAGAASSAGFMSDSSDGESEKCPICLLTFRTQEIGTPDACEHSFCAACLEEWSKNMTTCPVDRQAFSWILVRQKLQGKVIRKIKVEDRRLNDIPSLDEDIDPTFCEICGRNDREDRLLLCDGCDLGYHLECLDPPLETVPIDEWFCSQCANNTSNLAEEVEVYDGEVLDLLEDAGDIPILPRRSRLIPRTRQSERVRATIMSRRHERVTEPAMQLSTSGIDSLDNESIPSNSSGRRRLTTTTSRKRKDSRRSSKKGRKKTSSKRSKLAKSISQQGRRKIGRRKRCRRRSPRQEGIRSSIRPGTSFNSPRDRIMSELDTLRSRAGIPALHLFGQRDQLDYFSGSDDEPADVVAGETGVAVLPRRPVYSARSLASRKALSALVYRSHNPANSVRRRTDMVSSEHSENNITSNSCDILGSILDSQSIWHSNKAQVTISHDGSLEVKKDSSDVPKMEGEASSSGGGSQNNGEQSSMESNKNLPVPLERSNQPLNIRDASGQARQAPLYPGRDGVNSSGGSARPPASSGLGGFSRYASSTSSTSGSSYQSYQSGRGYSNFSSTSSFDAHGTRASYSSYLNNPPPPPPLSFRGSPMRFRLAPRFPLRRPPGPPPPRMLVPLPRKEEMRLDDSADVPEASRKLQDEEEEEIDIYSDIEIGVGGGGGPSGGGSEPDETDRNMDISYEALPPPPEPSALLMGLGEQVLSDDEQASDSELVIDDNVTPNSPQEQSENAPQIPESEKYDPAEPSYDSDDDVPVSVASNKNIPVESVAVVSSTSPLNTGVSQLQVSSSSNSNPSYLHSPTYGEKPVLESESTGPSEGMVTKVVQEVLKEHLSSALRRQSVSADAEEEDDDECPNFSIYSAQSMDIARRTGEENAEGKENMTEKEKISEEVEHVDNIQKIQDTEDKEDPDTTVVSEGEQHPTQEENDDDDDDTEELLKEDTDQNKDKDTSDVDDDIQDNSSDTHLLPDEEMPDKHESDHVVSGSIDNEHPNEDDVSHDEEKKEIQSNSPDDLIDQEKPGTDHEEHDDSGNGNEIENEEHCRPPSEPSDALPSDEKSKEEEEEFKSDDDDSLIGGATSAVSAATMDNNPPVSTPPGLEGLDTETISETEETINFDDISQDENEILTAEEDGEIPSHKKKKKKKSRKAGGGSSKDGGNLGDSELSPREIVDYEEGEIVDDRPKNQDISKKDKKPQEKKDRTRHDDENRHSPDENVDISQSKSITEEEKKKKKKKTGEKGRVSRERTVLGSSENKEKGREKSRRSEENISWKKPSKSTKGRNYRDGKATKVDEGAKKDRDSPKDSGKKDKKKKEKRKDMERYDVRKVVSDKKRRRRDEFGRDLSRDRSVSRSRSKSHRRSRDRSRQRSRSVSRGKRNRSRGRTPLKSRNRSRSHSRNRSRSRSHVRSHSRSRNRSSRRSRERIRKSRSKDRVRTRISRSHSRSKRSRSRTRSRSKNRLRGRSRSRSVIRTRERKDRTHSAKDVQRYHVRRSWSRTWTPSWSRSRSRSASCSSYSQSRSPSVRHYNHSYTRSFSRSWSRERHERIPVLDKKSLSKTQKKLTVIVNNTKDDSERQRKKEKKRKEGRKTKDISGAMEKRKKRKEKSPAPSKEVFTSGDNILVSVNFNKSNKTTAKDTSSSSLAALPKDSGKRKRDETFEGDIDSSKKARKSKGTKEKGSPRLKTGPPAEKTVLRSVGEKKSKKQTAKNSKSARMAAILKQKPVAIIDLDQSPFHEQTPSPADLIVLSDSDETANKAGAMEEMMESMSSRRGIRPASPNPPSKIAHNVTSGMSSSRNQESQSPLMSAISNYLVTSTGPKTPPEPQVKFSINTKPQLRTINNPLMEEDDMLGDDPGLEDSDQRIEEELDRDRVEIMHKGPNTPPEPRGPSTPCSPPTSPDAYDPFDPTKSGTPSPAGPEASMDGPPSPGGTPTDDMLQRVSGTGVGGGVGGGPGGGSDLEDLLNKSIESRVVKSPPLLSGEEVTEERSQSPDRTKARMDSVLAKSPSGIPESVSVSSQLPSDDLSQSLDLSESLEKTKTKPSNAGNTVVSENSAISPERKISVVITTQTPKMQSTPVKQQLFSTPSMKQIPVSQQNATSTPNHSNAPAPLFPTLTPANIASILCTPPANLNLSRTNIFNAPTPIAIPPLLQHIANATAVPPTQKTNTRMAPDKPVTSIMPLRSLVQNGEAPKQPPDTSTEVVDMDLDSPYSPGSSEGDDLFDPPVENTKANQQSYSSDRSRTSQQGNKSSSKLLGLPLVPLSTHKSPSKPAQDKFDTIFGVSPLRLNKSSNRSGHQNKSHHKIAKVKATKHGKGGKKEIVIKMDEDQLQILDDLPSSAVELQVKDKFLKKLNRQERVVEEVKLSLKPHYTKKHITKEEYKEILRKSVPKICHNKSGEINPVKISTLVEAYVRKYRYKKKNASSSSAPPTKPKPAKQSKWS